MNRVPHIFISSTCYDLKQIRSDIEAFIVDDLGYTPLLSESALFPIEPNLDTISNCRHVVQNDADVLVLIIGCRYGYVPPTAKQSVTNLEYLTAREKGIPIFVYVDKAILDMLPVYKDNINGKYSNVVDTPKLFDFVESIRTTDAVWVRPFEKAQDVIGDLRIQLAYAMSRGLDVAKRLSQVSDFGSLTELSASALRVALDKPLLWEYRLFAQVLDDEITKRSELRRQHDLGIAFGELRYLAVRDAPAWLKAQMTSILKTVRLLAKLYNEEFASAVGRPGEPGNRDYIVFVARQIGLIYAECLNWSARLRKLYIHDCYSASIEILALTVEGLLTPLEDLAKSAMRKIDEAEVMLGSGKKADLDLSFRISIDQTLIDQCSAELNKAAQYVILHANEF